MMVAEMELPCERAGLSASGIHQSTKTPPLLSMRRDLGLDASSRPRISLRNITAMAPMVVSQAHGATPAIGGLFDGLAFFILQRVPFRATYVQRIQANGGRVVRTEAQADHVIADHLRPDCPPGSISYTFIEAALKDGAIPNPADHHAGPVAGAIRDVGSVSVPRRSTKTAFTAAEDRQLWEWVEQAKENGGSVKGNEIYKQLERVNPRHSFQSWRDRYIKKLIDGPPPPGVGDNAPPAPLIEAEAQAESSQDARKRARAESETASELKKALDKAEVPDLGGSNADSPFTGPEFKAVLENGPDIMKVDEQRTVEAWAAWANSNPSHSVDEWIEFWEIIVKPLFLELREKITNSKRRRREVTVASDISTKAKIKPSTKAAAHRATASASPKKKRGRRRLSESDFSHLFTGGDDMEEPTPPPPPLAPERQVNPNAPIVLSSDDEGSDLGVVQPPKPNAEDDDVQLEITSQVDDTADMPPFTASGENHAADLHMRESGDDVVPVSDIPQLDSVTSDASRLAGQQLQLETDEPADFDLPQPNDGSAEDDLVISSHLIEDGEVEDGLPGEDIAEMDDGLPAYPFLQDDGVTTQVDKDQSPSSQKALPRDEQGSVPNVTDQVFSSQTALPKDDGRRQSDNENQDGSLFIVEGEAFSPHVNAAEDDARSAPLTAANLASQQAEHGSSVKRGTDLPVDDEQHDQTDYAYYLQSLMGYRQAGDQTSMLALAVDETEPTGEPRSVHLQLPSQQEIDDVLEDNLEWPSSPQHRKRTRETRVFGAISEQFETQTMHPNVSSDLVESETGDNVLLQPSRNGHSRDQRAPDQDIDEVLSQAEVEELDRAQSQRPNEDFLRGIASSKSTIVRDVLPRLDSGRDLHHEAAGPLNVEQGDGTHAMLPDLAAEDLDIDLVVPVPPGGFDLRSSPARAGPIQLRQRLASQLDDDEDKFVPESEGTNAPNAGQSDGQRQAIAISSAEPTSSPYKSSGEDELSQDGRRPVPAAQVFDTQYILNAETQQPDFDMPLPPDSEEYEDDEALSVLQSSSGTRIRNGNPSVTQSAIKRRTTLDHSYNVDRTETQALEGDDDIDDFIATRSLRFSIDEATIINALKATSMRPELAELVMLEQKAGKGLPNDVPGIWSAEEDEIIEGGNAKRINMVSQKHGWTEVIRRMNFLSEWRETSDE